MFTSKSNKTIEAAVISHNVRPGSASCIKMSYHINAKSDYLFKLNTRTTPETPASLIAKDGIPPVAMAALSSAIDNPSDTQASYADGRKADTIHNEKVLIFSGCTSITARPGNRRTPSFTKA